MELIVVLMVLGMAAAMAAPALARFSRGRQSVDAVAGLLAIIQFTQDRAITTATPHRLNLDAQTGEYWMTVRRQGGFVRLDQAFGRTCTLPVTVTASWAAPQGAAARGYLQFEPDGGHDTAVIALALREGRTLLIGCDSPNEPYRIVDANGHSESR